VVGDSKTGETDKYDGPYFVMQLLRHLPARMPMLNVGRGEAVVNLLPVDFAVDAMAGLASKPEAIGQVFQLADPQAMKSRELMSLMLAHMGKGRAYGTLPAQVLTTALSFAPLRRLLSMPRESIEYFNHEAVYDSTHTQKLLAGTGISCPPFSAYFDVIYRYMIDHPKP
jgi:hypothetical protein